MAADNVVETERRTYTDDYIGTREQLIEAGWARPGEFPGDPGRGKTIASYKADGTAIRHCRRSALDCGGRQITRATKGRFRIAVSISQAERTRRADEGCPKRSQQPEAESADAELLSAFRALPRSEREEWRRKIMERAAELRAYLLEMRGKDLGIAIDMADTPARLKKGERVLCFTDEDGYGDAATVIGEHQQRWVSCGDRREYRMGYIIKRDGESEEYFAAAHHLTRDDCKPSHLVLAHLS